MLIVSLALSDAEKKAKKKAKKAEKKVLEEAKKGMRRCRLFHLRLLCSLRISRTAPGTATNEDKGLDASPPKDDDPDGSKLLQAPEPLERAAKWLKPLNTLAAGNIEAWIAIYDVAVRRSKL